MNRLLIQRNLRLTLLTAGIALFAFAGAFVTAALYIG